MKNLELENYKVVEFKESEMTNTNGGFLPFVTICACYEVIAGCSVWDMKYNKMPFLAKFTNHEKINLLFDLFYLHIFDFI